MFECLLFLIQSDQPGAACHQMDSKKLSDDEKLELLHVHNDFRAKVARGEEQRGLGGGQPGGDIPSLVSYSTL